MNVFRAESICRGHTPLKMDKDTMQTPSFFGQSSKRNTILCIVLPFSNSPNYLLQPEQSSFEAMAKQKGCNQLFCNYCYYEHYGDVTRVTSFDSNLTSISFSVLFSLAYYFSLHNFQHLLAKVVLKVNQHRFSAGQPNLNLTWCS